MRLSPLIVVEPSLRDRVLDHIDSARDTQLPHCIRAMSFHGFYAEIQSPREFFVAIAERHEFYDLLLTRTKISVVAESLSSGGKITK